MSNVEKRPSSRRQATRSRLVEAAREVFAEVGVAGATVEQICARADFTRGAFYSNFSDKSELVKELLAHERDNRLDELDTTVTGGTQNEGFEVTIDRVMRDFLRVHSTDRTIFLIHQELLAQAVRDPALSEDYAEVAGALRSGLIKILEQAMPRTDREFIMPLADVVDVILGVVEMSSRPPLLSSEPQDGPNLAQRVLPTLLRAMTRSRPRVPAAE